MTIAIARNVMTTDNRTNEPRRLKSCVEAWPECATGDYNPACCRFPKSCSATVYSEEHVTEDDLEPRAALVAAGVAPQEPSRLPDFFAPKPMPNSYVPAPVLPSSGVDEVELAEVIAKSRGFGKGWEQIPPLTREAYREVARAVAEWLKGQGNAARE